jgi:hypothetical protein
MNKTAIKNYATWAREELMERVEQKAYEYGVTEETVPSYHTETIHGRILSYEEQNQLDELIKEVNKNGFHHVVEEVAYTWFNRFIALRFMEVNNYLPQRIRVFTNEKNEYKPEILTEAIHVELKGLDKQKVYDYLENNDQEELYKYLLLTTCNDMNAYLPEMFTSIKDYKTLLFPNNLLREGSVIDRLIKDIPVEDFQDQVQIIGWLYQYYVSERHNQVVNISKGTVKKEDIPAATELFTTDWVVRYMVDNSLGRYWIERNSNSPLKDKLQYLATSKDGSVPFVDDPKRPEEITFFDPCIGSGHILVYAFDVLMEIYKECGYSERDAAVSIVKYNLYGLDIDTRAYQLAYFAVMMKARSYNRRILTQHVKNNICNIVETNDIESLSFEGMEETEDSKEISEYLLQAFKDALELGSLCPIEKKDYKSYMSLIDSIHESHPITMDSMTWINETYYFIKRLVKQAIILSNTYSITTTNPPYLNKMEGNLKKFVTTNYKDYSADLFSVFMKRNFLFTEENGYLGFMTPFVWMFIKTYEKLRHYIIDNKSISTLVQMEYSAYEEATVPICTFVLRNKHTDDLGYYFRLSDFKGGMEVQKQKVLEAISNKDCGYFYETDSNNFSKIPGSPVAYWLSKQEYQLFDQNEVLRAYADCNNGFTTGDNNKFLRLWFEVEDNKINFNACSNEDSIKSECKWFPYNKGGEFRKWYGNNDYLINWENNGKDLKDYGHLVGRSMKYQFQESVTWSKISSGKCSFRYKKIGTMFDVAGLSLFSFDNENNKYFLGLLNSNITLNLLQALSPTLNYETGQMSSIPVVIESKEDVLNITNDNINLSQSDWDSFETSWDFKVHPLVKNHTNTIEQAYELWNEECNTRFNTLKSNEEELNRIFIDIYGLQEELDPYVEDKDVTVRKADKSRDIKSFISYAVGCMLGRYSLDEEGLAYAGGEYDSNKYKTYKPDRDNILPILDEEYFEDDIVSRFIEFVKTVYGEETLEENLRYIADALNGKGNSREVIRNYFLNEFFKDHCNTYQVTGSGKRPIYWLFDSGKKNGFKALIYMHRYTPDLIARMRTEYIHPLQSKYRSQIEYLGKQIEESSNTSERVKLQKELKKIEEQAEELNKYEEKIHHYADKMETIDLDDGVKVNYAKFSDLLAKIK